MLNDIVRRAAREIRGFVDHLVKADNREQIEDSLGPLGTWSRAGCISKADRKSVTEVHAMAIRTTICRDGKVQACPQDTVPVADIASMSCQKRAVVRVLSLDQLLLKLEVGFG